MGLKTDGQTGRRRLDWCEWEGRRLGVTPLHYASLLISRGGSLVSGVSLLFHTRGPAATAGARRAIS